MNTLKGLFLAVMVTIVATGGCMDHPATDGWVVSSAVDGDTLVVVPPHMGLPAPLGDTLRLRVHGVDTPESHNPRCAGEYADALRAHEFTVSMLHRLVARTIRVCGWDK